MSEGIPRPNSFRVGQPQFQGTATNRRRRLLHGPTTKTGQPVPRYINLFPPHILPLPLIFGTTAVKRTCRFFEEAIQDLIETRDKFQNMSLINKDTLEVLTWDYNTQIEWLRKERVCRAAFRRLVQIWFQKRQSLRLLNTEDPATLSEPIKKVSVQDSVSRGTFQQEASTLKKSIERDLTYAEWMFPECRAPKNPFTNLPFTARQILRIMEQLRSHQQTSWVLEGQRATQFSLRLFRESQMVPLKLRALTDLLHNPTTEDTITLFYEFIEEQYDQHDLNNITALGNLIWAVKKGVETPQIQRWRDMFAKFQKQEILQGRKFILENDRLRQELQDSTQDLFLEKDALSELARQRQEANRAPIPNVLRITNHLIVPFPIIPVIPVVPPVPAAPLVATGQLEQDGDNEDNEEEKEAEEDDLFNID